MFKDGLYNISQKYASKWLVLIFDVCIVLFTFFLAYLIRYNFKLDFDFGKFLAEIPFVAINAIISFLIVGTHKGVVRFIGIKDVINIIIGVNILATILLIETFLTRQFNFFIACDIPGSIIYIHLLLNILLLISTKFFIKASYKAIISGFKPKTNVLIYGAGNSGNLTYDAIVNDTKSNYEVIGFIDNDERKIGKKINLLKVYSAEDIDDDFIEKHAINEVIISIQSISYHRLLEISSVFLEKSIKVKIVPPVQQWIDGDLQASQIKPVKIEDLLGREPISLENPLLVEEYDNKVILVSGAAGSIGSEIARNLCSFNFKKMILVDIAESALYDIQQEFVQKGITDYVTIVTDVRCPIRMERILAEHRPEIIFHAAAYKHVPLMENNPQEAVSINIGGTINISNLAVKHGVEKFVMISTDKAVNPTNVMGATKRVAELYISCLKGKGKTKFITTRFGNVLGSNGSVIPLFKKQIENGGPLTVTHRDITRFFMTIPEACSLVLEAAAMGNGGEIFVFDMGESVKIFDLAVNMIKLSGLKYPEDIDIKIVGLRPGEKIYEELLADGENTKQTYHEKIMIAKSKKIDIQEIQEKILELNNTNLNCQSIEIVSKLKDIVPEYISNNSKFEVLDKAKN
ncbi:polysaccharide biosynthesis protein [Flavobacteriaceae bacterium S0825]|uniref:polysaccharide biosynthesis protein n=1 Tax=Gaetbulibacter sp. S0825 TaxID=2720084 RepID=UPI001431FED2|nr:nucleoside-diphosphate sugar epimerase/dehydratase [Gaetbulibacter sp. S0825]MCK0109698.1 polysaccharide biosynthesis protein [Flavobacteriaceae bacterium S0825]NIX65330.1 polysaccharide biosynthesis protein [Gaetbulibacter sp. S0825]